MEHKKLTCGGFCYFLPPLLRQDSQCICGPPCACPTLRPARPHTDTALPLQPGRPALPGLTTPTPALHSPFSSPSHCCQCCCSSSTPALVSRPASTALAAVVSPYTPSWTPFRDTTRMAPMTPVTSDSSQDFTSSSEW